MKLLQILLAVFVVAIVATKAAAWSFGSGPPVAADEFGHVSRLFFVDDWARLSQYKSKSTVVTRIPIKKSGKMYATISRLFARPIKKYKRSVKSIMRQHNRDQSKISQNVSQK